MTPGLSWRVEADPHRVSLEGEITEDTDFSPLTAALGSATTLDLAEVRRINSCGVREWINFMGELKAAGKSLVLERCSLPFVAQLNMISNFRGHAEVHSVFAPYFCPSCEAEHQELVNLREGIEAQLAKPVTCPACGAAMEFDDFPESFLRFQTS